MIEFRIQEPGVSHKLYSTSKVAFNRWHQITATFDCAGMKLYFDGQLESNNAYSGGILMNNEPMVIGASTFNSNTNSSVPMSAYFTGLMDELSFWNRALSANEIQDMS